MSILHANAWIMAVASALAFNVAAARDKRCDSPPYGDSPEAFAAYRADSDKSIAILQEACEAKFSRTNRAAFYAAGIRDVDMEQHYPVEIATRYSDILRGKLRESAEPMSIVDFALDGKLLANRAAFITVQGAYVKQGNIETLYADIQAVLQSQYNAGATPPQIALLTQDASRQFRKYLLACQAHPTYSQVGCPVTLWGHATMCTLTSAFGATRVEPCIHVVDGE